MQPDTSHRLRVRTFSPRAGEGGAKRRMRALCAKSRALTPPLSRRRERGFDHGEPARPGSDAQAGEGRRSRRVSEARLRRRRHAFPLPVRALLPHAGEGGAKRRMRALCAQSRTLIPTPLPQAGEGHRSRRAGQARLRCTGGRGAWITACQRGQAPTPQARLSPSCSSPSPARGRRWREATDEGALREEPDPHPIPSPACG